MLEWVYLVRPARLLEDTPFTTTLVMYHLIIQLCGPEITLLCRSEIIVGTVTTQLRSPNTVGMIGS